MWSSREFAGANWTHIDRQPLRRLARQNSPRMGASNAAVVNRSRQVVVLSRVPARSADGLAQKEQRYGLRETDSPPRTDVRIGSPVRRARTLSDSASGSVVETGDVVISQSAPGVVGALQR